MGAEAIRELLRDLNLRKHPRRSAQRVQGDERTEAPQGDQAARSCRGISHQRQPSRVDGARSRAGHRARAAPDGAARRRPFCDVRPQRSLPPRHQPQQPPQAAARAQRARDHHQEREAHAARSGRCADRQRPARPSGHGARTIVRSSRSPTFSKASRDASARTCSASASTIRDVRSSSSVRRSSCISAACPKRWRSSSSSRS